MKAFSGLVDVDKISNPRVPIRDAAAIILLDQQNNQTRVLMGKRSHKLAFMPNMYVFPGGRRDRADSTQSINSDLHHHVKQSLMAKTYKAASPKLARALAVTAARELQEETNLVLTKNFSKESSQFDLAPMRYIARAITPPKNVRRYDTRFFVCFCSDYDLESQKLVESDELSDFVWNPVNNTENIEMPQITKLVLKHLSHQLSIDSTLSNAPEVMFFKEIRGSHEQSLLQLP